jgi:hypothetical protein
MKPLEPDLGWNRKRLLIVMSFVIAILVIALIFLAKSNPQLKGSRTFSPPANDSFDKASNEFSQGIRNNILSIQEDAKSLSVSDVATSSPQVQKVIKDIQSIQDLPSSKAKEACQKICDGL